MQRVRPSRVLQLAFALPLDLATSHAHNLLALLLGTLVEAHTLQTDNILVPLVTYAAAVLLPF